MKAEAMHKHAYRLAIAIMVSLITATPLLVRGSVEAAEFNNRQLNLGDSNAGVVTTHELSMDYITNSSVGSVEFQYCANSPLLIDPCIAPIGLDVLSANLSSETGETGFSIHANTTVNRLVLSRVASVVTPQNSRYLFTNITNPSSVGSYYTRIGSYASTDGTGSRIDQGGLAFAITVPVTVGAYVPPILLFCLGQVIPTNSCADATGNNLDFGDLSPTNTSFGTTQMLAGTNGFGGYTISVIGTSMTSGNNVIPPLATATSSAQGVSQFGINLVNNSSPNVGNNVTGSGSGVPNPGYNQVNKYKFVNGDIVASSSISSDINKYTSSYIVNVSDQQQAGIYATTLTYVAFASF